MYIPHLPHIVLKQHITAAEVSITHVQKSTRTIDPALEKKIDATWSDILLEAQAHNKQIWDSQIYRIEDIAITADQTEKKLRIVFTTIPYSKRYPMNRLEKEVETLGFDYAAHSAYASIFVHTVDGYFIFIKKSSKYFTEKNIDFVGGAYSADEQKIVDGNDLFLATHKEIVEEIGVPAQHIAHSHICTIYATKRGNFCFLFDVQLSLTREEVEQHFARDNDGEAESVVCVKGRAGLNDFRREVSEETKYKIEAYLDV